MGFMAWKPEPLTVNLLAPGASGSDASELWSERNFQPFGACANAGARASSAANTNPMKCFIAVPPREMASPDDTPVARRFGNPDLGSAHPPRWPGIFNSVGCVPYQVAEKF
jgi:hypothetical protein